MENDQERIPLFSYGSLQQAEVQLQTLGRLLEGTPDTLPGYKLDAVAIIDAAVIAASGSATHRIARATGCLEDLIPGKLFWLTHQELAACDAYEVDAYKRVEVRLASGTQAHAYVAA